MNHLLLYGFGGHICELSFIYMDMDNYIHYVEPTILTVWRYKLRPQAVDAFWMKLSYLLPMA